MGEAIFRAAKAAVLIAPGALRTLTGAELSRMLASVSINADRPSARWQLRALRPQEKTKSLDARDNLSRFASYRLLAGLQRNFVEVVPDAGEFHTGSVIRNSEATAGPENIIFLHPSLRRKGQSERQ